MLQLRKTRRKIRPVFRFLSFCIVVFFIICLGGILLLWVSFSHRTILSPLAREIAHTTGSSIEDQASQELLIRHIEYVSVSSNGDTITILLPSNIQVVLTSKKEISSQIASLQLTIQNLTIEKRKPVKIDFRFDRPVLSY